MKIRQYFNRSLVVFFWVALIFGILYWPKNLFFHEKKSINVFAWGDILEDSVVADFEKASGIKVNLSYYASNEEMIIKLKATGGEGYDMVVPSDYSVEILRKENLLKKLDKTKLNFLDNLNPNLTNLFFDPGNLYSVPFEWELYVLGIDKDFFQNKPLNPSWKMIFDPNTIDYKISMINDPIQAVTLASFYLYGSIPTITDAQLKEITQLLLTQKQYVNAYADFRADYFLATKNSAVAVATSSYIWRTMKKFPFVGYVTPKEGTFITIENFCIPVTSTKQDLTYQLMNYLYTRQSMKTHYDTFGIFPSTLDVMDDLDLTPDARELITMSSPELRPLLFTRLLTSQEKIRDAWVQIKTE